MQIPIYTQKSRREEHLSDAEKSLCGAKQVLLLRTRWCGHSSIADSGIKFHGKAAPVVVDGIDTCYKVVDQ